MDTSPFGFVWQAPVNGDGFLLTERPLKKAAPWRTGKKTIQLIEHVEGAEFRDYLPQAEEKALYKIFSHLDSDAFPQACLAFANKFGLLGVGKAMGKERGHALGPEPVKEWEWRKNWLRDIGMLEYFAYKMPEMLETYMEWDGPQVYFRRLSTSGKHKRLDPELARGFALEEEQDRFVIHTEFLRPELAALLTRGDSVAAARLFLQVLLTDALRGAGKVEMVWDRKTAGPVLRIRPQNLWGLICLQMAESIESETDYRACVVCGQWFELSPGVNRADKTTCSDACRQRAQYLRRVEALKMHAEGKEIAEIAKTVRSAEETVRGWIEAKKKEK